MGKKLKKWNGRGPSYGDYNRWHVNVAAYSKKQAAELINKHVPGCHSSVTEITNYYSSCWGNDMSGIEPTEPCVYVTIGAGANFKREKLYPKD